MDNEYWTLNRSTAVDRNMADDKEMTSMIPRTRGKHANMAQ